MPRDPRPYVTYPLNYTGHPRIESMSDAAFRAFHEMNDHSRVHGLDGVIPVVQARRRWKPKVLAELCKGIDGRPLVVSTDDAYVLRSYEEHQFTTGDVAKLREVKAAAGRSGGVASGSARRSKTEAPASRAGKQNEAMSESELKLNLTDINYLPQSGHLGNARAENTDTNFVDGLKAKTLIDAEALGIKALPEIRDWAEKAINRTLNLGETLRLAAGIIGRAKGEVRDPDRYVIGVCRKSPARVVEYADLLDLGVAS